MCPGPWKCSPTSSPTEHHHPPIFLDFSVILLLFYNLKRRTFPYLEMCPGPWKCFPTLSPTVRNTPTGHCQVEYSGLFICICLHILSFPNNLTNKVYILQKKPCHLDQNWWSYVEIFILVKIDTLNIFVFGPFICICLHILSFQNTPTNNLYILQKRPCYLDQNWRSYVEIFISAKIDVWQSSSEP